MYHVIAHCFWILNACCITVSCETVGNQSKMGVILFNWFSLSLSLFSPSSLIGSVLWLWYWWWTNEFSWCFSSEPGFGGHNTVYGMSNQLLSFKQIYFDMYLEIVESNFIVSYVLIRNFILLIKLCALVYFDWNGKEVQLERLVGRSLYCIRCFKLQR